MFFWKNLFDARFLSMLSRSEMAVLKEFTYIQVKPHYLEDLESRYF